VADSRAVLGIVYCPVCEQDTMPSDRTGCCLFCDTLIVEPVERDGDEVAA
jgi:hypothetical protein